MNSDRVAEILTLQANCDVKSRSQKKPFPEGAEYRYVHSKGHTDDSGVPEDNHSYSGLC